MRSNGGAPNGKVLFAANGLSLVNCGVDAAGVIVVVTEVVGRLAGIAARPQPAAADAVSRMVAGKRISLSVLRRHRRARTDGSSDPKRATASGKTEKTRLAARWRARRRRSRCASTAGWARSR